MSVHSVDSSGKGSGKVTKKLVPTAPVANPSGVIKVVHNPALVPGATVAPGASARVLTQVTALPKAAPSAQPTLDIQTTADDTDDAAAQAPATSADFGKMVLQNAGIAPEAPTLQTRTQYIALANYLMASSRVESAPVAAHDAPVADAGGHASVTHTSATHTAGTRRVDVSA